MTPKQQQAQAMAQAMNVPIYKIIPRDGYGVAPEDAPAHWCGQKMQTGTCNMQPGHKGRHTTVAWECDGCGKSQRSHPEYRHPEAGWYCFLCVVVYGDHY